MPYPINLKELKKDEEYWNRLLESTFFVPKKGPDFEVKCGRVRLSGKDNVKNVINLVYEFIPQILVQSVKNSTVKKVCLKVNGSKDLPLYENDFVVELN